MQRDNEAKRGSQVQESSGAAYSNRPPQPPAATGGNAALKNFDSLLASFQQKKQQQAAEKAAAPPTEEIRQEVVDQQVKYSSEVVQQAIATLAEEMKAANRITLATALDQTVISLEFNKVKMAVGTEVERNMLERDRTEVAVQLRNKTGYTALFVEMVVDPAMIPQHEQRPYTLEDKLKVLTEKNPAMKRLQETFRTRILQ